MKQKLILAMGIACLVASCSEDDVIENKVTPTPGAEVQFTSGIGSSKVGSLSRTLPGADSDEATAIKVKWVNNDLITVYGADCANKQAEYKVTATSATSNTPHSDDGQDYADALEKTGEAGVQWGTANKSVFYAVYPSVADGDITETSTGVTIKTSIRQEQKNKFEKSGNVWVGTPYVNDLNNPTMSDAVMYARTEEIDNGSVVDLNFKPITTVLKFKIGGEKGFQLTNVDAVYVSKITLTAPEGVSIAGDFNLALPKTGDPTITTAGNNSNTISVTPNYLPVANGQWIEFSVYAFPCSDNTDNFDFSKSQWTVQLETATKTFTYKLTPSNTTDGLTTALTKGKIHKVDVAGLSVSEEWKFEPGTWMQYIPRNVYLSELSLPGAWYCLNSEFQATTDLATQYAAGVRAFHLDCRMTKDSESGSNLAFVVAGSDGVGDAGINYDQGDLVADKISDIAKLITSEEYVVVVLSVAEKPMTRNPLLSDTKVNGNVDPEQILAAITSMINTNAAAWKLYTDEITPNTTVNDVLNHMIIKVNMNTTADKYTTYNSLPGTLISECSMAAGEGTDYNTTTDDIIAGTFNEMVERVMYWGNKKSDLMFYYHQAQKTYSSATKHADAGVPYYDDRKEAIDDIIAKSDGIYALNKHNAWYQLGIGGYRRNYTYYGDVVKTQENENRTDVASVLNSYVLDKVNTKLNSTPSPIGIVLMNYCTNPSGSDYYGPALVDAILQMNGKFYLNRNPEAEEWPNGKPYEKNGSTSTPTPSAVATVTNVGEAF